jgi:hypothetical protein
MSDEKCPIDCRVEVTAALARIEEHLRNQDVKINRMDTALNGNGKPGLTTRVDRLEISEKRRAVSEGNVRKVMYGAISAAAASIIGAIVAWLSKG